ncbi:PAS modulated sigma54 specific transcriptional regulator, Fis family [Desulfotomaculum nigrificans CO-1-SRB]|uniref:PAS modulated sigma54 specific transcriptional regulator, Fis family n=1 Tax=Desulfotomaculum nigrificans (strain DSM 14880 / VKM B-2319 / CO-1-SRB) TaxID=868595 RepID=F6B5C9_DESCC|nr:sigma-54-dependent Fis family transcriptional regulator [Desulfotomaculum nigrificans]AEF94250.1 PAS modulated sigma54 specific transcriptional regulator, Fis family [Desulfotomaculum nigrificans CO-1-SRB]
MLPLDMVSAILDSVQEAIEITDRDGNIIYVNPAFCRITGIPFAQRTRENIFNISPDGALALALKTGKPVSGHRTKVGGSNAEVISNAVPILVDNQIVGAIAIFQHITDVIKLLEELRQSTNIIRNLSDKFGQVTQGKYTFEHIIGSSRSIRECIKTAQMAASSNSTVLLLGETGTGKELFAHAIHNASPRKDNPFITINCAAIPDALLESELFGHVKGAFTGAIKEKIGKFELAHSGTLFLDEIGDMNLLLQAKLLRVLQEREFERVGSNQTITIDVRVIAATNRNLRQLVREGKFREDLFYRLNVVEINLPPLREHTEDLLDLANHFIIKLNRKLGKKVTGITSEALAALHNYNWPGNIRELQNIMERVMLSLENQQVTLQDLAPHLGININPLTQTEEMELLPLDKVEQIMIQRALNKFGSSVEGKKEAAKFLNISLATLYNKIKKYKINF